MPLNDSQMNEDEARRLAEFVKDHDKRFTAKAQTESGQSHVLLTRVSDGAALDPVTSREDYAARFLNAEDPGPTVRAAWDKWGD